MITSCNKLQSSRAVVLSFSWVPRNKLPPCVSCWISQQISSIGYCRSQRATVSFKQNRTLFSQDSNACTRSMTTWSQCILCHWTRKDLHWTSAWRMYRVHSTCYTVCTEFELEPFFYSNNCVEIRVIGKSVSLCFSEDVDEIISVELQNPATFATLHAGLICPIRQAISKVSNTFNT